MAELTALFALIMDAEHLIIEVKCAVERLVCVAEQTGRLTPATQLSVVLCS